MTKLLAAGVALLGVVVLTACDPVESDPTYTPPPPGGVGVVLGPKGPGLGIDMGGGLYLNPATGGVGFGVPLG
ncbi:membrane protein [Mycobacterium phage Reindeer]|uniref:Membrane protein n=1 Tax=Mycobacterium phage Reindeer TaxID=2762283 RepID=A0A7G8LHY3_9CAUD|nr:membrane protein [Mycobacterium phage Reindeer]QNJ56855.1 membrane protein [Mycobacterium phage Reindeer]